MYFPYFRGRQFELIALRELLDLKVMHEKIVPIIEPVKLSSTLTKTLAMFLNEHREIAVIHNPQVGSFKLEVAKESSLKEIYISQLENTLIIKSHLINRKSETEILELNTFGVMPQDLLTLTLDVDNLEYFERLFDNSCGRLNIIPDERQLKRSVTNNKVLIEDSFIKQTKNSDYKDKPDEFFSDNHLYFNEEGYVGFSDYSVVGNIYSESGFAPYAVAIHIVYFDTKKNLRIMHFVSDSNDDIQDPGGKFYEAVRKLYVWSEENTIRTYGLNELVKHYRNQTYPGLGTVKKLSIMHHMELMSQYFRGEI
ncbi:sce7725 family protein [Paenibacillus sp. GXUN7292]|uniref:sce7725 family protein n=1 Tax=Paenibacillus sp. GXUN7292 TaxID=3422499 RepID=UPI003D7C400A